MVVVDRSPFRIAGLCVEADKALYHEHRRLLRCRRLERRLRLETSFLKYKLALVRKQRGETINVLSAKKKANARVGEDEASDERTYILADSDSDEDATVYTVLTDERRRQLRPAEELEEVPIVSPPKTVSVPKRPTNGYLCFCAQMRPLVLKIVCKAESLKQQEMQRVLSQVWKELPIELKKYYYAMYEKDKVRYKQQMRVYNAKRVAEETGVGENVENGEQFAMPNYLLEIPRFLMRLVDQALLRESESGLINIERDMIRKMATPADEDFLSVPPEELPPGLIASAEGNED